MTRPIRALTLRQPWAWVGWYLREVVVLGELVRCSGRQGLWTLPDDVLGETRGRYRQALEAA